MKWKIVHSAKYKKTTQTARCGTLKASSCTAGTKLHETLEAVMRAPPCICLCRQPGNLFRNPKHKDFQKLKRIESLGGKKDKGSNTKILLALYDCENAFWQMVLVTEKPACCVEKCPTLTFLISWEMSPCLSLESPPGRPQPRFLWN